MQATNYYCGNLRCVGLLGNSQACLATSSAVLGMHFSKVLGVMEAWQYTTPLASQLIRQQVRGVFLRCGTPRTLQKCMPRTPRTLPSTPRRLQSSKPQLTVRKPIKSSVLSPTLLQIYCIGLIGLITHLFWQIIQDGIQVRGARFQMNWLFLKVSSSLCYSNSLSISLCQYFSISHLWRVSPIIQPPPIHFHRPPVYHPTLHSSICPIEQLFWFSVGGSS